MDLTIFGLEPFVALPVVAVITMAMMVYVFGFQKSEEPSYEHLAILQSSGYKKKVFTQSHNKNIYSQITQQKVVKSEKNLANNRVVLGGSNASNRTHNNVMQSKAATRAANIKNQQSAENEIDDGEWIQAQTRRDRKKKTTNRKDIGKTMEKIDLQAEEKHSANHVEYKNKSLKVVESSTAPLQKTQECLNSEAIISTSKTGNMTDTLETSRDDSQKVIIESPRASTTVTKPVASNNSREAEDSALSSTEMKDTWEEAKSRGAKKRRIRKDC